MPFKFLTLEVGDRIATLTVNRPDKLNALNDATIAELGNAIDQIRVDDSVGGVILTGAGRAFIAGADISELSGQTPVLGKARARAGQDVFRRFETCPKPVIAAVNGFALGGGCELAMACHIRIASDAAKFGQPESKLGILPGYGGSQRLPRLVGKGRAMQLLLTGEMIDAATALEFGLINRVVPADALTETVNDYAALIAAKSPAAVKLGKQAVREQASMDLPQAYERASRAMIENMLAADCEEGISAFFEKREPKWQS